MAERKTKCTHEIRITTWHPTTGKEMHQRCSPTFGCGEQLAIGPSCDWPDEVQVEMRAAEIAVSEPGDAGYLSGAAEYSGDIDNFTGSDRLDGEDLHGWSAAWLAREIRAFDSFEFQRDDEWPWDPTRPVAGQYEEWLVAQQTRHDVAASVVRHAEAYDDTMPTVSIDSDEHGLAVQINGVDSQDVSPMYSPDEAEVIADDIRAGADAARQAERDGHSGPAVVVDLIVGDEPEAGVEVEVVTVHEDEFPCERCETILREHAQAPGTPACTVDSQECQIRGKCTNKCGAHDERACAACETSDGCEEHQIFTCARCGRKTDWKDGCCDDENGKGGDECSECWLSQQPTDPDTKFGEMARQIAVPVTDVGDGVIVHHDGETATYTEEHDA